MPSLHVYIIMFQDTQRKTQVHRKKDDGRQPEAEENQVEDMIGAFKT